MKINTWLRIILILSTIFCISCVEHYFLITVSPSGTFLLDYKAHGDRKDLLDADFPMPQKTGWVINSSLDQGDAESQDYTAYKLFQSNESAPESFFMGDSIYQSSLLLHPIRVKYRNWFFKKTYSLNARFKSRGVNEKYPRVNSLIDNPENPDDGWIKEVFGYLITETLSRTPVEFNQKAMVETDLRSWLITEVNILEDSTLIERFDALKEEGLDIIMQPVSPTHFDYMDSLYTSLEDEMRITLDLIDDEFNFKIILPGNITNTNADTTIIDTLAWSFRITNFASDDFKMIANSEITYPNRAKIAVVCIVFIILFVLFRRKN